MLANQFKAQIINNYPEYKELVNILELAKLTWPAFGLDAEKLSQQDPLLIQMLRIAMKI